MASGTLTQIGDTQGITPPTTPPPAEDVPVSTGNEFTLRFVVKRKRPTNARSTLDRRFEDHTRKSYETAIHLFGHDREGVNAWQGVRNLLKQYNPFHSSPSIQATRFITNWLKANKPTDSGSITRLAEQSGVPERYTQRIEHLLSTIRTDGEVPPDMLHTPLDMHLAAGTYHPSFRNFENHSDILSELRASSLTDATESQAIKDAYYPIRSDLVKLITESPALRQLPIRMGNRRIDVSPYKWVQTFGNEINNNPIYHLSFKSAVENAASKLNWPVDDVQESFWTLITALLAAHSGKMSLRKLQEALDKDALAKGYQPNESKLFATLVTSPGIQTATAAANGRMAQTAYGAAKGASRPGIVFRGNAANDQYSDAAIQPATKSGGLVDRFRTHYRSHLANQGIIDPSTGQLRNQRKGVPITLSNIRDALARIGVPLKAAHYDDYLDFIPALQRATSSNHKLFLDHLRQVLVNAGVYPQNLLPAIHDLGNAARVSAVALGELTNPNAPKDAAAWAGILGRQPGMLAFTSHPEGKDSVYNFAHQDANAVRQALDASGVSNRVLVPSGTTFNVYLYDKGRKDRAKISQALGTLGVTADEWFVNAEEVGGNMDDMGRAQYRDQINKAETRVVNNGEQPTG